LIQYVTNIAKKFNKIFTYFSTLIKKYCENVKEIKNLKYDLDVAKKETKHNISNYTSAMDKIRELELVSNILS
jgi:hypothetical protein